MFGRTTLSKRVERLESELAGIRRLYEKTLSYSDSDPETALMNARKAAEAVCSQVFEHKVGKPPKSMTLQPLIEKLTQLDAFPEHILVSLRTIQGFGNLGSHHQPGEPAEITPEFAQPCLAALGTVVQWYFKEYGSGVAAGPIITTRTTRSRQHHHSGNAVPWIAIVAATAAVAALLLAGVAAWNTRNRPKPKAPSVTPSTETAAIPSHPTVAAAQETTKPTSPTGRDKTAAPSTIPKVTDFVRPSIAGKPRVAVLPFQQLSDSPDSNGLQQGIGTVVAARLEQSGVFDLVERSRLDEVLAELELSQTSKFDPSQVAKIGKLLGAKQLVLGSFFPFGDKLRLDARFVDTETGQVLYSVDRDGVPDKVDLITHSLCDGLISKHPDQARLAPHIIRTDNGRLFDTIEKKYLDGRGGGF